MSSVFVVPVLTPHGRFILSEDRDASALEPELARRLQNAFARGSGHGLLQLRAREVGVPLPPSFPIGENSGRDIKRPVVNKREGLFILARRSGGDASALAG